MSRAGDLGGHMVKAAKFGGSSLADAVQFQKVRDIVCADDTRRVVVVSAPGKRHGGDNKVTDLLYLCHAHLQYGVSCESVFAMIEDRFRDIQQGCGIPADLAPEFACIRGSMRKGMPIDELVSRGEYLTAKLMAAYLGFDFVDAADWVTFGYDGKLDAPRSEQRLRELLAEHPRMVVPGFYGALPNGKLRLLSRGGSDITGSLAAAAADAAVYENWTDVSGVLMADPRVVPNPKPIPHITYGELRELAYMGANVLHEEAVFPVRQINIPINIRNTNAPDEAGTLICEHFDRETHEERARFITGISGHTGFSIITLRKSRLAAEPGALRSALAVFEQFGVPVEHIPGGIDSFSPVVSSEQAAPVLYDILGELHRCCAPDSLTVTDNIALIAVVGRKMASLPGVSGKIFGALGAHNVNIRMIAQGPDEINIIVGVENGDFEKAIRILYNSFVIGGSGQ